MAKNREPFPQRAARHRHLTKLYGARRLAIRSTEWEPEVAEIIRQTTLKAVSNLQGSLTAVSINFKLPGLPDVSVDFPADCPGPNNRSQVQIAETIIGLAFLALEHIHRFDSPQASPALQRFRWIIKENKA